MNDMRMKLRRRSTGFTLVEVMVSLALVLLVLLAVNTIFRTTADTVGAGQALSGALRNQKALGTNLALDILGNSEDTGSGIAIPAEAPYILISSQRVSAFMNRQDELSDPDWASAADKDLRIRTIGGTATPVAIYNTRNHRVDQLSFFSKGSFTRQTADNGLVAPFVSPEAMIWYGHLDVYDGAGSETDAGSYPDPGDYPAAGNPNPDNFYASDWRLGRMAILMKDPVDAGGAVDHDGMILDANGLNQTHFYHKWVTPTALTVAGEELSPLSFSSAIGPPIDLNVTMPQSRYDLAGVSMVNYRARMKQVMTDMPLYEWWNNAVGGTHGRRFWCNPLVSGMGMNNSASMARTVGQLGRGSTQFMVEFAGDFVTQNPVDGKMTAATSDGILDFVVQDPTGVRIHSIRWYGFPRDVNGDGIITGSAATDADKAASVDVFPVRDFANGTQAFEKVVPVSTGADYVAAVGGLNPTDRYVCGWNPTQFDIAPNAPRPWMIRILATFTDRNGRLVDGLTQQYVFNLDRP